MDHFTRELIVLNHCRGVGRKMIWRLLHRDPNLIRFRNYSTRDIQQFFHLSQAKATIFVDDLHQLDANKLLSMLHAQQITPISFQHSSYPKLLKHIFDPPYLIYAKGNVSLLNETKMLSVVGTRHPSREALQIINKIVVPLIKSGWTIVSGMAMGIDGMAHQQALAHQTIAVLGSGLNHPYPRQNHFLFKQMCAAQLVISEYPPDARPERWRFPERNRIISGMTLGTLVIEAKEKSGSLITADQALDQGRDVFAVPGSIFKETCGGTHRLIQQGAKLVCDWQDIIQELNWRME
ncbi:DNA-processing protein DprA [Sporolactobacillus terrae]|uniref:DNA-processing protein DprA n=1 Tax=Sporolactobacillus terrae TaxID=269673 RepID=UPI00048D26B5|nr:DNA-processing protein DprA [Sporolactobacillus terrae]